MKLLCDKFSHTRFEPIGCTGNPDIGYREDIMDYIFRWLELRFVTGRQYPLFKDMVLPPQSGGAISNEPLAISEGGAAVSTQHSAFSRHRRVEPCRRRVDLERSVDLSRPRLR